MKRLVGGSSCFLALALMLSPLAWAGPKPSPKAKPAEKAKSADTAKPAEEPKKEPPAKPVTFKVKKEPVKIELTLEGVFEAQTMMELSIRPEEWSGFVVAKAVEHGTKVKRGDVLVTLETDKIDQALADLRLDHRLAELSIRQAEQAMRATDVSAPMDLALAHRLRRNAAEDLTRFLGVDRPMLEKMAEFFLKMASQSLEYEQEELRQLEKMYKADDITEETEEIVLKRARNAVEQGKFQVEVAKLQFEEMTKVNLPRRTESVTESDRRAGLELQRVGTTLLISVERQRLELEKLKTQQTRSDEKYRKLSQDRAAMVVKAPVAGIVYYGKCVGGKWSTPSSMGERLRHGDNLPVNDTFMTIVEPRPMRVRAAAGEKQLQYLHAGLKGRAEATGYPDVKLPVSVEQVDAVPVSSGKYNMVINVALDGQAAAIMPGMTCELKFVPYLKKDALTLPPSAIQEDKLDDQKHFVYVPDKSGKPRRVDVVLGKRTDKQVEILQGLVAGQEVLQEGPKDEK